MKRKAKAAQSSGPPQLSTQEVQELVQSFEAQIKFQEDVVYGVALFFEGLSLLYADQADVIETYQRQFRNIIQIGSNMAQQASALLEQVKQDSTKAHLLMEFKFNPCEGHPDPEEMTKRARILVKTYDEVFPGRDRSQAFTEEEVFRLVEATGDRVR